MGLSSGVTGIILFMVRLSKPDDPVVEDRAE